MGDRWELVPGDEAWPKAVSELDGAPDRIYGRGDKTSLEGPFLSIIGARRSTPYGLAIAEMAGRVAAQCGLTVVSGGAMGCDRAALRAALDEGGRVVVVSGVGADRVYPSTSRDVFEDAVTHRGSVISIERWGTGPSTWTFPKRNRVIAALGQALMVCEAGVPSGTFSTANAAVELGRSVYAAPGSVFSPSSRGTNMLISQGASVICDEQALETCISLEYGRLRLAGERGAEATWGRVMTALISNPMRPDELATRLGENVLDMVRKLVGYEADGLVTRLPDGRYSPTRDAYLRRGDQAGPSGGTDARRGRFTWE